MYQKLWSDAVQFLRYDARQMDGQTDGQADRWTDGWTDRQADGKSNKQRWVPHLKILYNHYPIKIFIYNTNVYTLNGFANVICICFFRDAKSANCVEIKWK